MGGSLGALAKRRATQLASAVGRDSRLRTLTRRMRIEPPMRLVPSRRGLAVTFGVHAGLGFLVGLGVLWLVH